MNSRSLISFVVPVYNRPHEVRELLESFLLQKDSHYEIIIVEDGSQVPASTEVMSFREQLPICYVTTENGGPSHARNIGVRHAHGTILVFLDSDTVLPSEYIPNIRKALAETDEGNSRVDLFGGPDAAHENFSIIQKAINYSMTSTLTTGGIRGKKKHLGRYCPRSFNMGCSKELFEKIGGFDTTMRFGEDMDFCLKAYEAGAQVKLFEKAWVYHKRRIDFKKFYKQVYNSGIARINLAKRHPGSLQIVHLLPAVATLMLFIIVIAAFFYPSLLYIPALIALLIFVDAFRTTKSLKVSLPAVMATFIQISGYGLGFWTAFFQRYIRRKGEFSAFHRNFYQ